MIFSLTYLPESSPDIREAFAFYDSRSTGLGDEFLDQMRDDAEQIRINPFLHSIIQDEVRAAPMRRFPYVIYYRIEETKVMILTVQYSGRDSMWWKRRSKSR
jgi:plasmid stabilization system protein ParE